MNVSKFKHFIGIYQSEKIKFDQKKLHTPYLILYVFINLVRNKYFWFFKVSVTVLEVRSIFTKNLKKCR